MNQNSVEDNDRKGLTPEGQIKIISIASEQTAPMADLATFAKALDAFCREDYYGDKPYDLLVRSSQFSWNQYDQFAAVLIKAAHAAEVEDGVAEAAVKMYRDIFIEMAGDANDILSAIQASAADEEQKDRVSVLSIPCGSGKSTALTKLIYDVIRRNDSQGLIIVTDSVERMSEYWNPETENPAYDDALLRFISWNQDKVAVIHSQNYDQMKMRQRYAPVVVLTTQRYFGLTPERIKEFLRWEKGTRPLIIFDEAPYLSTERDVTPATINTVASALRMCIEATDEESRDVKQTAIALWEEIRSMLLGVMDKLEYTPELQYAFIPGKEDDTFANFLTYVQEHRSELDTNTVKIVQMVEDVMRLLQGWGVYSHRNAAKSGKYESKFTVHVDYRELLTELGAKVIILDGTADISPMYGEDYIHMLPTRSYSKSLSYLTIKLCDLPTGESDLRSNPLETAKMIRAYLAAATNNDRNLVIFSSEKMETAFRNSGHDKEHTGHFNNIKGLNTYKTALNIAQVGLNRKPPVDYLTLDLARNEDVRTQLIADTESEGFIVAMNNARKTLDYNVDTMTRHVLADMEQNLYRGVIRNAANTTPYTYYVFFEHQAYESLIVMIKKRYEVLGAKVEFVSQDEIEQYKPKSTVEARIDAIEEWYKNWDGRPVKQSAVYKKLGMNRNDFNYVLTHEKAEKIRGMIEEAKEAAQSTGEKKGWLIKKR